MEEEVNGAGLVSIIAALGAVFLWIKSGRSPLWWGIVVFTVLEAVRFEAWACLVPAYVEFVRRVRIRVDEIRQEMGAAA
jgi:hypothetical protein